MIITIKTIPHDQQRYPTVGDWKWINDNNLEITVSEMGDWKYEVLVGIHEAHEALICKERGIEQSEVDDFDMAFEARREEGNTDEPGDDIMAPYYSEHQFATGIERLFAIELGVNWNAYDQTVSSL